MEVLDAVRPETKVHTRAIPGDAQIVISMLNGEAGPGLDRRRFARTSFQMAAALESVGEPIAMRWGIYTRDASQWGVGFVTQHPLPVAKDVMLTIAAGGQMLRLRGSIVRCREIMPGWYDGAVLLHEEEHRLRL